MGTRRIRLGADEKIELEVVGEDDRVYLLRGAIATRVEVLMGARGGEVRATFIYDFAEIIDEEPIGRVDEPKRDARGRKRPPESYSRERDTPRSSNPFDPSARSPFDRGGRRSDGWPEDMADPSVDERFKREPEPPPFDPFSAPPPPRGRPGGFGSARPGGAPPDDFFSWFNRNFGGAPRSSAPTGWRATLENPTDLAAAEASYRRLAKVRHPDRGGTHEQMVELNAAIEAARRHWR